MYFLKKVEDKVRVEPNLLGMELTNAVTKILRERYERRIFKELGLVLAVQGVELSHDGIIIPGDGGIYYTSTFELLTFMPFVNEVYEGEVKDIVDFGAFVNIGPLEGLLHVSQISNGRFNFDKKAKSLVSRAEKKSIKKGDVVLAKVSTVSMKATTADSKIGLTMRPEGLGKLEWLEEKRKAASHKKKE